MFFKKSEQEKKVGNGVGIKGIPDFFRLSLCGTFLSKIKNGTIK